VADMHRGDNVQEILGAIGQQGLKWGGALSAWKKGKNVKVKVWTLAIAPLA